MEDIIRPDKRLLTKSWYILLTISLLILMVVLILPFTMESFIGAVGWKRSRNMAVTAMPFPEKSQLKSPRKLQFAKRKKKNQQSFKSKTYTRCSKKG